MIGLIGGMEGEAARKVAAISDSVSSFGVACEASCDFPKTEVGSNLHLTTEKEGVLLERWLSS